MLKTRDIVQPTNEALFTCMPRTPGIRAYPRTLSQGASTTVPQPKLLMDTHIASQNDAVDIILPAFLLLGILVIVTFILGSSESQEITTRRTRPRESYQTNKESARSRRNKQVADRARTRMSISKLPIEVIEHIIDYLRDNNLALATCKLVHRTWLPRARMLLHRTIIFEHGGPDPFKLKFFPQVAQHVRELTVSHPLLREVSSSILVEIDRVELLRVIATPGTSLVGPRLLSVSDFPSFSRLNELHLNSDVFSNQWAMLFCIAKVPHTSSLTIDISPPRPNWASNHSMVAQTWESWTRSASIKLDTLHLRYRWVNFILFGTLPQTLLELAGGSLKHLTLTHFHHGSLEAVFHAHRDTDFSKNVSLETLTFDFNWAPTLWYTGQTMHTHISQLVTFFLSSLRNTKLRSLSFRILILADHNSLMWQLRHLNIGWLNSFVSPRLEEIDGLQAREETRSLVEKLESVDVELRFSCKLRMEEGAEIRNHLLTQLTSLVARGVLKLTVMV
ncbi:hypothetical protein BDY19DRAFT_942737 [Irpex rosettiformis]|uniref:Uncharacterized protein n=1 Tax=Irpex rosettiformis TaxID=378272 RepID=A0ACB8U5I9_9APHY|nr:hypothetical protein BDY19DRAFT_942737 [Irpex rosettiformis]